jgi:AraC family transcriptional activator of pobA
VQPHRRSAELRERDFARHHDAGHYADALAVPPAALSRALVQVTGRPTKELVTDRVMLQAARLLRFTDLPVQEIAFRTGFEDPLYFSRAFKRRNGEAPVAYRERARGTGTIEA